MSLDDVEALPVLDKEAAIKQLGDAALFETMMEGFNDMSLRKNLTGLKIAFDELDYFNIRLQAHSLNGTSGYLHAERVKTIAEKLQMDVDSQKVDSMFKDYPALIKQCVMLKKAIRFENCKKAST